jgi:endo-1,4-beta-mannosidase
MSWWSNFDLAEVEADFARIAACGLDSVRVFLTWEDFQPAPDQVDQWMLERLVEVADLAAGRGLALIPTLFTGHMSGVNWIPAWALGGPDGDRRFRVVSGGRVVRAGLRNWYTDPAVGDAQALLAAEAAAALAGHEAVWAWDLGNENSNCVRPPTRTAARDWLAHLSAAIRGANDTARITVGLHMEDLEEDRRLGPLEASKVCDLLSMHGYPIYARWAHGPTDDELLPFLARMTYWLGEGRDVLFSEFGLPTYRRGDLVEQNAGARRPTSLVEEEVAAAYTTAALKALRRAGCVGALLWCYSDYAPSLLEHPPFDLALHERTFGLWRADGSPKPAAAAIAAFAGAERCTPGDGDVWIDIGRDEFLRDPDVQLPRLYRRYREHSRDEHTMSDMTD